MSKSITAVLIAVAIFAAGYWFGHSRRVETPHAPISGVVDSATVAQGVTEHKPDTVRVLVPVYKERPGETHPDTVIVETFERVPMHEVADTARLHALTLTAEDWSAARTYSGTLFDDVQAGTATYSFTVQHNRAGAIAYEYTPAPRVPERKEWRRVAVADFYGRGVVSVGYGVRRGRFDVTGRVLRLSGDDYRLGVGVVVAF